MYLPFSPQLEMHLEEDSLVQKGLIFLVSAGTEEGLARASIIHKTTWSALGPHRQEKVRVPVGHGQLQNSLGCVLILWSN